MQVQAQDAREPFEVVVGGQDGCVPSDGRSADQEIRIGPLNPFCSTSVETGSGLLVVGLLENHVAESSKSLAQLLELVVRSDPGQELLANGSQHEHAALPNELDQLGLG